VAFALGLTKRERPSGPQCRVGRRQLRDESLPERRVLRAHDFFVPTRKELLLL